jgi:ATP-binding cassette, subfamily C (CFTR/MRP), member 1
LVLKGLNLKIEGGSKVGIVGRTGAGKSTISLAISRIVEIEKGSIKIDGVDSQSVSLDKLR